MISRSLTSSSSRASSLAIQALSIADGMGLARIIRVLQQLQAGESDAPTIHLVRVCNVLYNVDGYVVCFELKSAVQTDIAVIYKDKTL
jgi:hypothetical protein